MHSTCFEARLSSHKDSGRVRVLHSDSCILCDESHKAIFVELCSKYLPNQFIFVRATNGSIISKSFSLGKALRRFELFTV